MVGRAIHLSQSDGHAQLQGCEAAQAFTFSDDPSGDRTVEVTPMVSPFSGSIKEVYRAAIY